MNESDVKAVLARLPREEKEMLVRLPPKEAMVILEMHHTFPDARREADFGLSAGEHDDDQERIRAKAESRPDTDDDSRPPEDVIGEDVVAPAESPTPPGVFVDDGLTIQERFERFDAENPLVWSTLVRLAYKAKESGANRLGIRTLWEVMRWEIFLQTRDPSGLKLNDHYHSRYVRKLVDAYPDDFGEGFFELRRLRAP